MIDPSMKFIFSLCHVPYNNFRTPPSIMSYRKISRASSTMPPATADTRSVMSENDENIFSPSEFCSPLNILADAAFAQDTPKTSKQPTNKKMKKDENRPDEGLLKIMEQNMDAIQKLSEPWYNKFFLS